MLGIEDEGIPFRHHEAKLKKVKYVISAKRKFARCTKKKRKKKTIIYTINMPFHRDLSKCSMTKIVM